MARPLGSYFFLDWKSSSKQSSSDACSPTTKTPESAATPQVEETREAPRPNGSVSPEAHRPRGTLENQTKTEPAMAPSQHPKDLQTLQQCIWLEDNIRRTDRMLIRCSIHLDGMNNLAKSIGKDLQDIKAELEILEKKRRAQGTRRKHLVDEMPFVSSKEVDGEKLPIGQETFLDAKLFVGPKETVGESLPVAHGDLFGGKPFTGSKEAVGESLPASLFDGKLSIGAKEAVEESLPVSQEIFSDEKPSVGVKKAAGEESLAAVTQEIVLDEKLSVGPKEAVEKSPPVTQEIFFDAESSISPGTLVDQNPLDTAQLESSALSCITEASSADEQGPSSLPTQAVQQPPTGSPELSPRACIPEQSEHQLIQTTELPLPPEAPRSPVGGEISLGILSPASTEGPEYELSTGHLGHDQHPSTRPIDSPSTPAPSLVPRSQALEGSRRLQHTTSLPPSQPTILSSPGQTPDPPEPGRHESSPSSAAAQDKPPSAHGQQGAEGRLRDDVPGPETPPPPPHRSRRTASSSSSSSSSATPSPPRSSSSKIQEKVAIFTSPQSGPAQAKPSRASAQAIKVQERIQFWSRIDT